MMNPSAMALMTMTVMLWIIWSDTIRVRRPTPILYTVRIALFLVVTGLLILNLFRHPDVFAGGARALTVVAIVIGVAGAAYFARRLVRRT